MDVLEPESEKIRHNWKSDPAGVLPYSSFKAIYSVIYAISSDLGRYNIMARF